MAYDEEEDFEEEQLEVAVSSEEMAKARRDLEARCKIAGLPFEEDLLLTDEEPAFRLTMKCGREFRYLFLTSHEAVLQLLSIPFEKYVFVSDYNAICSYEDGTIEAAVHQIGALGLQTGLFRRLFSKTEGSNNESIKVILESSHSALPHIEFSPPSEVFRILLRFYSPSQLTLKLSGCNASTHDQALNLLKKLSHSVFFQIDLVADVSIALGRQRRRLMRRPRKRVNLATELQYPTTEFDEAPISLYWYARSASGMPLLQFLAFYQVIEFYFPTYSQATIQRKIKQS